MIVVESLYDYENFNSILKRILTEDKINIQNNVLPINDIISYHISCKNFAVVKSIFEVMSNKENNSIVELSPGITVIDHDMVKNFITTNKITNDHYVFCGSRAAFAETFGLNVYSPSVNQFIVAAYETMSCIKFVGPGRGSFVIFKPILDISRDIFDGIVASRKDFFSNPKNFKYILRLLEQDIKYYTQVIEGLVDQNKQFKLQLEYAEKKQYMTTQMTWR
jgi:hypothetical protein